MFEMLGTFYPGIEQNYLEPGCSYREMAVKAGYAYIRIFYMEDHLWPFDDPNPFEKS